ncbi:hypothetical protein CPLU01_12780 [Colletotrichum plurivorum]|uniref:Uncharacterized protein n=1 Tax=Colletotrichum plurivorum TaxID=2175906 RepID=A0A8H6JX68_9PEZI|nr:hypothetical protein CPLU01_12780 [Colletotrichum plurivorum]
MFETAKKTGVLGGVPLDATAKLLQNDDPGQRTIRIALTQRSADGVRTSPLRNGAVTGLLLLSPTLSRVAAAPTG